MQPKWLKHLETTNQVFINHLNNYPETQLGKEVGDNFEGKTSAELFVDHYYSSGENLSSKEEQMLNMMGIYGSGSGLKVTITKSRSLVEYVDDNYFVYCVCLKKDPKIQKSFGSGLQVIYDFNAYIQAISLELNKLGIILYDAGPCRYLLERKQHFTEKDFTSDEREFILTKPYLVKEKRYEYQNEFRVVWRYLDNRKIDKPLIIQLERALKNNSHMAYLKDPTEKEKKKKKKK